ncbi:hypothetical protein Tco_1465254 [Tanacetum coccineum]
MSTSNNSNQQTLVDSGANERPPMLERGNYIPWESRFRRFLDNKLEEGERMWNLIQNGPYVRPMIPDPNSTMNINGTVKQILEPLSKMTKVDACKRAKEMWKRIKRLMFSSDVTSHVRHSRLMDEFDTFEAKEGESLESVYERLTTLVNIMDRNNVRPISVSINTKFLNCLQPEWSKYVTMVRHNQTGETVSYDMLYDSLVQFEPHVLASKAKKAAKNHDPLALIAHSNASSSQSHANSSYSPQPYYVTHPSSVVDYEDEYQGELQGDSQEDKLTTAMMLLARAITQKFSTPTNNRLRTSSNTRNQAVIQDGRVDIQTKNAGYGGNGNKNAGRQSRNQAFNAGNGNDDSNQIIQRVPRTDSLCERQMFSVITAMKKATMLLIVRNQEFVINVETVPSYDAKAVSEVNASSKVHEQMRHEKCKTIIQTSADDQIDSNIIFDDP